MSVLDDIYPLIEQKLSQLDIELYDIKFIRAGSRSIFRVFIDKKTGITIDDCETASREISTLLDVENFSSTPYTLEVSSPGLDRPLKSERDFKRAVGENVILIVEIPKESIKTVKGRLVSCERGILTLENAEKTISIALSDTKNGKIEITF